MTDDGDRAGRRPEPTGTPAPGSSGRPSTCSRCAGFENVTTDEVADAAGISRRTFFRYYATKADAVLGRLRRPRRPAGGPLAASDPAQPVLASVCAAYVEVNDYADAELPLLRERMQLILTEPALLAHSQLRFAEVDRVVARHVAARTGAAPDRPACPGWSRRPPGPPRRRRSRPGWPTSGRSLGRQLHLAFDEITDGFPGLRLTGRGADQKYWAPPWIDRCSAVMNGASSETRKATASAIWSASA